MTEYSSLYGTARYDYSYYDTIYYDDSISLTDSYSRIWNVTKVLLEDINLEDTKKLFSSIILEEELNLLDTPLILTNKSLLDNLELEDSYSRIWISTPTLLETLSLTDGDNYHSSKDLFESLSLSVPPPTKKTYEYFIKDAGAMGSGNPNYKFGQTFTVGNVGENVNHYLYSVTLKLYRKGNPGTFTVEVYATDENGLPTGDILSRGTINGNTITTDIAGEEVEIIMDEVLLNESTEYALVFYGAIDEDNFIWHKGSFGINEEEKW
jgi:hypothetical protein